MKWKQKARKAALRAACGAVLQSAEDSEVMNFMLEDHPSDYQNNRKKHNIKLCHLRFGTACKRMRMVATCLQTLLLQCVMFIPSQTPHEPNMNLS